MSYTFLGLILDATQSEYSILNENYPAKELVDPVRLLYVEPGEMDFDLLDSIAQRISAKLIGRTVAAVEYMTWGGAPCGFNGSLYRNGRKDYLFNFSKIESSEEPFFKLLLEFGIVLPDSGYFSPFDRSLVNHVGG
jgi:hypothetical protein